MATTLAETKDVTAGVGEALSLHHGTLTMLFVDVGGVEGSAPPADERWLEVTEAYRFVIAQRMTAHVGLCPRVWRDGMKAGFGDAGAAQRCAVAIQRSVARYGVRHPGVALGVRIGIHTGRVVRVGGDLYGVHVDLAAGIADAAETGEILVSTTARARTPAATGLRYGPARTLQLDGVGDLQRVFALEWRAGRHHDRPRLLVAVGGGRRGA